MIPRCFLSLGLVVLLMMPLAGKAGSITTSEIVVRTMDAAMSCMQWMQFNSRTPSIGRYRL